MNPILILPLAFICEFIDSSLGMGYGTTLTQLRQQLFFIFFCQAFAG